MKKYQSYKPSGVEWIGDIPDTWKVIRVKHLVDKSKYYQIGDGDHGSIKPEMYVEKGIPYIRVQNLNWNGEIELNGLVYITNEIHKKNLKSRIIVGDILIAKTGATIGKLGYVKSNIGESNTTSSVGKVTIDKNRYIPEFYLYNFQTNYFQKKIWITGSQKSAQPGFNIDDLVDFEVIYPPLQEQEQIVNYLDKKTTIIDKLISTKQRKVELLKEQRISLINQVITKGLNPNVKMKDSGVEWIGKIPEGWIIKKMKYCLKMISEKKEVSIEDIKISPENVENGTGICFNFYSDYSGEGMKFIEGDILLNKLRIYLKKILITESEGFSMGEMIVLRTIDGLNKYYYYTLFNQGLIDLLNNQSTGVKLPRVSPETILNSEIVYPPIEEQKEIIDYIDKHTKEIDNLVSMEKNKIELLKEYRQSLISEVITGKIKVVC